MKNILWCTKNILAVAFFIFSCFFIQTVNAGSPVYVNSAMLDDAGDGLTPETAKKYIQSGISAVDANGFVYVASGDYLETGQFVIDKNLSIVGVSSSTTMIKAATSTTASGDAKGWWLVNPGIVFNLSDVTLDGNGNKIFQGIRHKGTGTIQNVHFTDIKYNESGPDYAGFAVYAFGQVGSVDILDCAFDNIGREGVAYWGAGTTGTYTHNYYTGKGLGNWLDYAVEVTNSAVVTIATSTITNNRGTATSDGSDSAGIIVLLDSSLATISGNTLTENTIGIKVGYNTPTSTATAYMNNNKVYNNYSSNAAAGAGVTFNAEYNWWGTSSSTEISANISGDMDIDPFWLDDEMTLPSTLIAVFDGIHSSLQADGIENNIDTCATAPNICSGLYFEKSVVVGTTTEKMGRITFNSDLDLTNEETQSFLQGLGSKFNANTAGIIGLDFSEATEYLALAGVGATIKFYGLDALGIDTGLSDLELTNLVNSKLTAFSDDGNLIATSTLISGDGVYVGACEVGGGCHTFTIGVNHFTTYEIDIVAPSDPSLDSVTTPTNFSTQTITGTKESNSSVLLNNVEIVPIDSSTSWSYEMSLISGNNLINLTSRDYAGNQSGTTTSVIFYNDSDDNTPPQLISATTVTKDRIDVYFDEDLIGGDLTTGDFKVDIDGNEYTISSLSELNGKVTLELDSLLSSDTPTITINPGAPASIKDLWENEQTETSSVVSVDAVDPTFSLLGDGESDYELPFLDTDLYGVTMIFSEELSASSKTAVQNTLNAGSNKELTFRWGTGSISNKLRVSVVGTSTAVFANDVIVSSITDLANNSTTSVLLIDSVLDSEQIAPVDGSAEINDTVSEVVITDPNEEVEITITSSAVEPKIDLSSFVTDGVGVIPKITITAANVGNATIAIPATTTVTSADTSWNGVIAAPTITTVILPDTSGVTKTVNTAIEVGFIGAKLSFDKAVRIFFPNQAGKRIGYVRTGTTFTEISSICSTDSQTAGDALIVDGDCKLDVGNDLVIWTKHFTSFATYTQTTNTTTTNYGGGGIVGSGPTAVGYTRTYPESMIYVQTSVIDRDFIQAEILRLTMLLNSLRTQVGGGYGMYIFINNLMYGMRHNDVINLQKVLNSDPETIVASSGAGSAGNETSFFGSATKAAVIKFQKKHGISPTLGYVGLITRSKLNEIDVK